MFGHKIPTSRQCIDIHINKIVINPNTLHLFPTNSTEMLQLINHLPNKTKSGHDEINTLLLKKIATSISNPLKSYSIIQLQTIPFLIT